MTEYTNPVWGPAETGTIHGTEAPPAGHPFLSTAACGQVITGQLAEKSSFGSDAEFCGTCEKSIEGTSEGASPKKEKATAEAPDGAQA